MRPLIAVAERSAVLAKDWPMVRQAVGTACLGMALVLFPCPVAAAPAANTPTAIPSATAAPSLGPVGFSTANRPQTQFSENDDQRLNRLATQSGDPAQAGPVGGSAPSEVAPAGGPREPDAAPGISDTDSKERLPLGRSTASGGGAPAVAHGDTASGWGWLLSTGAALGAVIGLILLLRTVLGRVTGRSTTPARTSIAEVLSRITLGPRSHILVVRMGRRILVLGEAPTGLSTLANIEDPEEVAGLLQSLTAAGSFSPSGVFNETLARFDGQYAEEAQPLPDTEAPTAVHVERARDQVSSLAARLRAMSGRGVGP